MFCPSPLIIALDCPCEHSALALADQVDPGLCRVKVGSELFSSAGPRIVEQLHGRGFEVFLDLKFHDIPVTVAKAVAAAARMGVWMLSLHASGGRAMMEASRRALADLSGPGPLLIAVTVLTSFENGVMGELGLPPLQEQVMRLAQLAGGAGMDGVVCSAVEAPEVRALLGEDKLLVTPGVRLPGKRQHDQKRVAAPQEAIRRGSDYLVVGRPVTEADCPARALEEMVASLSSERG